ncbi:hypothetical protein pb186bvf_015253 [Paramecium bursaria]
MSKSFLTQSSDMCLFNFEILYIIYHFINNGQFNNLNFQFYFIFVFQ